MPWPGEVKIRIYFILRKLNGVQDSPRSFKDPRETAKDQTVS